MRPLLGCFDHPTRFDTIGANDHFLGSALVQRADILQIWIKSSLGNIVGMAYIVTHHWLFSTYFTDSRHDNLSINIFSSALLIMNNDQLRTSFMPT